MGQVIHNLVINADQAMPAGGALNIRVENFVLDKKNPLQLAAGNYVRISVKDQGTGINQQDLPKIFDQVTADAGAVNVRRDRTLQHHGLKSDMTKEGEGGHYSG